MVRRKARYLPIQDTLSAEVAWEQSAHVLDLIVEIANEEADSETLLKAAALWAEMALHLGSESDSEEEEEETEVHDVESKSKVGF